MVFDNCYSMRGTPRTLHFSRCALHTAAVVLAAQFLRFPNFHGSCKLFHFLPADSSALLCLPPVVCGLRSKATPGLILLSFLLKAIAQPPVPPDHTSGFRAICLCRCFPIVLEVSIIFLDSLYPALIQARKVSQKDSK